MKEFYRKVYIDREKVSSVVKRKGGGMNVVFLKNLLMKLDFVIFKRVFRKRGTGGNILRLLS